VFGEMVRAHRRRLGLTQEELAERTGLSVRGIGNLEAGRIAEPRPTTVRLLADAFGLAGAERDSFCLAAAGEVSGGPSARVPAQLPPDVSAFAGRDEQLTWLDALVSVEAAQPAAVVISAIAGTAGVGKTALAIHWAHRVANRFPDGQLYVNLRGFHPAGSAMSPAAAIRGFLDSFGVPPHRIPADLDAQVGLFRSQLAGRRVLVVLDNARDTEQVRPLLPGAPGCLVLVTSRNELTGLIAAHAAHTITLDLLTEIEAQELLARRLGAHRVSSERQATEEIIVRCARLPLALAIVAARAAVRPSLSLRALAAELRETRAGTTLDGFASGDTTADVRTVFSWSYQALSPPAARLFRLLGLHPGPDASIPAVASLAGIPVARAQRLLTELLRMHLVTENIVGRYGFHDLLRAYAAELADEHDRESDRRAARDRMLDHYLHTAHSAAALLYPHRDPITLSPPQFGTLVEELSDYQQAWAWFTAERAVLPAAVRQAASHGYGAYTWKLAWTLVHFLLRRGLYHEHITIQQVALEAALRFGDQAGRAHAHAGLGLTHIRLGRFDQAEDDLRAALRLFGNLADRAGQAGIHLNLGWLFDLQSRHMEALHHAEHALDLYRADNDKVGQAVTLNSIGWVHAQHGDYQRALSDCRRALALHMEAGGQDARLADTWDSLGYVHCQLGQYREALSCYQNSYELVRALGDRQFEAEAIAKVGDTHRTAGDADAARTAWQDALAIFNALDHPDADQVRAKLRNLNHRDGPGP
jgi:tetratricopeptide (TPR) repeat protein/transcriptional regulator with XRE-family HTH domain